LTLAMPISSVPITKSLMDPTVSVELHTKRGFDVFLPAFLEKTGCVSYLMTILSINRQPTEFTSSTLFCEKIVSKCTFGVSLKPIIDILRF